MDMRMLIQQAICNLWATRMRSFLALLGVLIGTSSVVALIYCGQLATHTVVQQMNSLGTHLLSVSISTDRGRQNQSTSKLTVDDIEAMRLRHHRMHHVSPLAFLYRPMTIDGQHLHAPLVGGFSDLASIARYKLAQGRFFSRLDRGQNVCVIGAEVAKQLHALGVLAPIGKHIRVGNVYYEIIGVGRPWAMNFFITVDMNRAVMLPIHTLMLHQHDAQIRDLIMGFASTTNVVQMQPWIQADLHSMLGKARFFFRNPQQLVQRIVAQKRTFTMLLGVIGSIALLVGGIGIMNIMLVSVTERRREIGIRMAIGANPKAIQHLFLIESMVLSFMGGAIGVCLGLLAAYIIAFFAKWSFSLFLTPLLLGFCVSVSVGVFFGFYPAKKASQVDPIDALRDA